MTAPSALIFFESFREYLVDGTFDLNADIFMCQLQTSTFVPVVSTMTVLADLTNEVASGTGYTTGGNLLASVGLSRIAGTVTWDAADTSWTATTSSWVARYGVIYKLGTANGRVNPLIGYFLLDSTPADVIFNVSVLTSIEWNISGIFTLT